jgi:hypothetical protein
MKNSASGAGSWPGTTTVSRASAVAALLIAASSAGHAQTVSFAGQEWTPSGEIELREYMGREALLVRNGAVLLNGVNFADGVIEFDVAVTGDRCFPGVNFRIDDAERIAENVYLRPHNTGRFDAVQYAPMFDYRTAWQLYPEYNASLDIPVGEWIAIRLVISGSRMDMYVGERPDPVLTVEELRTPSRGGSIGLGSSFPGAADAARLFPVAFSAFRVRPGATPGEFLERGAPSTETGYITEWALSPAFSAAELPFRDLPEEIMASAGWSTATTDSDGRLTVSRYRAFPEGDEPAAVVARVVIRSDHDRTVRLAFGFSDFGTVFLRGEPVFSGNNRYLSRSGRYLGIMTIDNDALYLPLHQGDNELAFVIGEEFGGWGLTARLEGARGLDIRAARPRAQGQMPVDSRQPRGRTDSGNGS